MASSMMTAETPVYRTAARQWLSSTSLAADMQHARRRRAWRSPYRLAMWGAVGTSLATLGVWVAHSELQSSHSKNDNYNSVASTVWSDVSSQERSRFHLFQSGERRSKRRNSGTPASVMTSANVFPWNLFRNSDDTKNSSDDANTTNNPANNAANDTTQSERTYPNPAAYGWTPEQYPNPIVNPTLCAVAHLIGTPLSSSKTTSANSVDSNDDNRTTIEATAGVAQPDTELQQRQSSVLSPPLRLCDPDWVLGGVFLEDVATSLTNFSHVFSSAMHDTTDDGDWTVQIDAGQRRRQLDEASDIAEEDISSLEVPRTIELAVATVRKMNLPAVLQQSSYFSYEDEDDMINDAAQIFARTLHDAWWSDDGLAVANNNVNYRRHRPTDGSHGILLFVSVQDRVCFISTGSAVSHLLPWWRLDHVVASMKPDLRHRDYGNALLRAIDDVSRLLEAGPPTMRDWLHDFVSRFGVVIGFAMFTFLFGAWGEYRDRRKRWQHAESRSKLAWSDKAKAQQLQKEFRTRSCPICLENFDCGDESNPDKIEDRTATSPHCEDEDDDNDYEVETKYHVESLMHAVETASSYGTLRKSALDEYGIPRRGADGKKIKLLRCGHIFCLTCWKSWVHSGCGNPCNCPVCRQDVGKCGKRSSAGAPPQERAPPSRNSAHNNYRNRLDPDDILQTAGRTPPPSELNTARAPTVDQNDEGSGDEMDALVVSRNWNGRSF